MTAIDVKCGECFKYVGKEGLYMKVVGGLVCLDTGSFVSAPYYQSYEYDEEHCDYWYDEVESVEVKFVVDK